MMNQRGQIMIFVVTALLIIVAVAVYFVWISPSSSIGRITGLSFESCVESASVEAIKELEKTAGIESKFTYPYNGDKVPYLCYTDEFYKTCTVQEALLTRQFEKNLKALTKDKVQSCYDSNVNSLRSQGYEVKEGQLEFEPSLELGRVKISIKAPTTIDSASFSKVDLSFQSPIYEMLMFASTITQQEARFGDSDLDSLRLYYPDYIFLKTKRGDGTTIYTIKSKKFGDEISFASKSLPWPAGYER